jgi:hypothetical protein
LHPLGAAGLSGLDIFMPGKGFAPQLLITCAKLWKLLDEEFALLTFTLTTLLLLWPVD